MINKFSLTGFKAFSKSLEILFSDGGEIWLKIGTNKFYQGFIDAGNITELYSTKGEKNDRVRVSRIKSPFDYLRKASETQDGGALFIPAKPHGFPLTEYVQQSDLLSCEMDGGSTSEQWERLEKFVSITGLSFAAIIHSGSKSLHGHIKLVNPVGIDTRTQWQRLLSIAMLSDPMVNSPHQPMRIPGFFRLEKGKEQTLESYSETKHTFDEIWEGFRKIFDVEGYQFYTSFTPERWSKIFKILCNRANIEKGEIKLSPDEQKAEIKRILSLTEDEITPPRKIYSNDNFSYSGDVIPLEFFLPKSLQEILQSGISAGSEGRNPTAFKLSQVLQGTEETLNRLGVKYSGDSYQLVSIFGSRCHPSINIDGAYKNAKKYPLQIDEADINKKISYWEYSNNPDSFADSVRKNNQSNQSNSNQQIPKPSEVEKAIAERRRLTKFSPNIPVINEKYIPIDVVRNNLKPDVSIGIKSPTNSGKSFLINQLSKTDLKNHYLVYLTARESLSRNFAKNSGALLYKDKGFETLSRRKNAFVVVTIDSILKIPFEMIVENGWKLAIIGDESEEITRHIINAGTIKGRQGIILERLAEMVKYATFRLHLDGHLTDATVDYWDTIAGKKSIKIQNTFVNPRPPIKIFKDINTAKHFCKVIPLMQEILENEQRILFQSDSSKLTESYGIILDNGNNNSLIGTRDIKGGKNGKQTAELISKFLDDPAQTINDYPEKKIIGMSPIIQSGVDISYSDEQQNRPDAGFYFSSHLGIDAFLQTLIRERRPELVRYLAVVDSVKMTEDDNILATALSDIERIEKRKIIDIYKSYGDDINEQNAQILEIVRQALESPETKIRQHYKTIDNIDKLYHKDVLIACLNDDGYTDIEFITIDDELIIASGGEKELEGLVKGEKNKLDESHCVDVFDSPDLSEEAARELEKKPGDISYQSGCSLKKHKIKEKIPGCPITLDLLKDLIINKKDCLKKAEARALITYSQELTNRRTKYIDSIIKYNPKLLKNKDYTEDLKLLVKTDILRMVEELKGDRTITSDSEPIMKWIERFSAFSGRNCRENVNETEEQFNARCKKWVMNTVNHHLAIIGFNLATVERKAKVRYRTLRDDLILESTPNILDYVNARICELANIPYIPSWEMPQEPTTPFSECGTLPPLTHLTYVENKPTPSSDKLPYLDMNNLGDLSSPPVSLTPTTEYFEPTPSSDKLPHIDIEKIAKLSSAPDETTPVLEPTPEPITTPEPDPEPLSWKGVMGRIKTDIAPYWHSVYTIYKERNPLTRSGARVKSVDSAPTWKHNAMAPNDGGWTLLVEIEGLIGTKVNIPIDCLEFEG